MKMTIVTIMVTIVIVTTVGYLPRIDMSADHDSGLGSEIANITEVVVARYRPTIVTK